MDGLVSVSYRPVIGQIVLVSDITGGFTATTSFLGFTAENAMTSIMWLHFCVLGVGALLLVYKAVSLGGIYDTWAPGGGDVRRILHPTLRPSTILGYLVSSITRRLYDEGVRLHWRWEPVGSVPILGRWKIGRLQ